MIEYLVSQSMLGILLLMAFWGLRTAPADARLKVSLAGLLAWCLPFHLVRAPVAAVEPIAASRTWLVEVIARSVAPAVSPTGFGMHQMILWGFISALLIGGVWFGLDAWRSLAAQRELKAVGRKVIIDGRAFSFLRGRSLTIGVIPESYEACVTGMLVPRIWIGSRHLEGDHLAGVLCHEWLHAKRHDGLLQCAIHLVQRLFWWNPVCRFFGRKAKACVEYRCDAACCRALSSDVYEAHLAEALLHHADLGFSGGVALGYIRHRNLDMDRIRDLRRTKKMRCRHYGLVMAVGFLGISVAAGKTVLPANPEPSSGVLALSAFAPAVQQDPTDEVTSNEPVRATDPGVVPPEFTKKVDPIFPEKAKEQGSKGRVILEVVAGADGKMRDVNVIKVEGDQDVGFQEAATEAVMQWEVKPATRDGKPVDALLTMKIEFKLN